MIDKQHLRLVQSIEQHGSLTAAADALFVTQSSLSHKIRKLEDNLGTPLWHREGRQLRLTQAGQYLLAHANRLLPQLDHLEHTLMQMAQGEMGTLRIGMECHPCYRWLIKQVEPFLKKWPNVDIDVKQRFQFGGVGALFDYEIDLLVTPDPFVTKGLNFEPVFGYELVLVIPSNHVLAQNEFIVPESLVSETLITYPVPKSRLDIFIEFLNPAGIAPKLHKSFETTEIMLQMVASDRGVAALPKWLVDEYAAELAITGVRLGKQGIHKSIHLGRREDNQQMSYLDDFIDLAKVGNAQNF